MYWQLEKNLLNNKTPSACPHNMVNFGLLTAEICWRVWGIPANFNGFRVLAALLHGTLLVAVSQTAALNRGRHLYLAGRPSRWALAHISSFYLSCLLSVPVTYFCMWLLLTTLVVQVEQSLQHVCVCLFLPTIPFELNDLWPGYLLCWLMLTLCGSSSKMKVKGQSSESQEGKCG